MNWISSNKARSRLGVDKPLFNALTKSGLLGYTLSGMYSDQAILAYQQFGTQWSIDERRGTSTRIMTDDTYDNLPPVENVGHQPPGTQTHAIITPPNAVARDTRASDRGWIAHFYLLTNYWCFPNLTELALVGAPPLKLSEPKPVPSAELPVTLYPHPSGYLGLVVVKGLDRPLEGAHKAAYNAAMPVLDELSARYDVPLPVAHSMEVGVPSGTIHLDFAHRPRAKEIESEAEVLPRCPHPELRYAYAL